MLDAFPMLSIMMLIPLLGAFFILTIREDAKEYVQNIKMVSLLTSGIVFILSIILFLMFDEDSVEAFQFQESLLLWPAIGFGYQIGIDGIALFFIMLSAFLTPICLLISFETIKERLREYVIAFLVLETLMIGTFCALDIILFYVFFEAVLIPMFLIIGVWGGDNRVYASFKFFLYTLLGSVLLLVAVLYLVGTYETTSIAELSTYEYGLGLQKWIWVAFFASFAVKVPMWPFHTWLPDAHVQAPTAGSVLLAGVLLKIGGYGFMRLSLPMLPEASLYFAPFVMTLSVIAIIYTSLIALVQNDMKKLIAYSSVAHMGYVTLGLFSLTEEGMQGALFQMISHGVISAALFICVGVIYSRLHTRDLEKFGGLARPMPKFAILFMVLTLGSVGLPITSGFIGEFLSLLGAFQNYPEYAMIATIGIILGAAYMLRLYRAMFFEEARSDEAKQAKECTSLEVGVLIPMVALVFILGIFPNVIFEKTKPAVDRIEQLMSSDQGSYQNAGHIQEIGGGYE